VATVTTGTAASLLTPRLHLHLRRANSRSYKRAHLKTSSASGT
jgi:hypothetical protein